MKMKKLLKIYLFSILMVFWAAGSAFAISLGTNITIPDGVGYGTGWYSDTHEDEEVEPNCVANQSWDLESFFLDGTTLTMVGGFDFENGYGGYQSGDIFIDTNGDAQYGSDYTKWQSTDGYQETSNNFGYEYALHLNFASSGNTYTVYNLNPSSILSVYYSQNEKSNPLSYVSGGDDLGTGDFAYTTGLNDSDVGGLVGDVGGNPSHNAVAIDLGYLITAIAPTGDNLDNFTAHFTEGCGNDNLMGSGSVPVPEPATVMLLGTGLLGMIAFGRKRFNKKV